MAVSDTEDDANQASERVRTMVDSMEAVEFEGVEVREVVAHA